jgi:hypothetical protein
MITAEVVALVEVVAVVFAFSSRPRLPLPYLAFPAAPAHPDTHWPLLPCFAGSVVSVLVLTELMIVGSADSLGHFVDWLHP